MEIVLPYFMGNKKALLTKRFFKGIFFVFIAT